MVRSRTDFDLWVITELQFFKQFTKDLILLCLRAFDLSRELLFLAEPGQVKKGDRQLNGEKMN